MATEHPVTSVSKETLPNYLTAVYGRSANGYSIQRPMALPHGKSPKPMQEVDVDP